MSGDSISVKLPAQFFIFEFGSWILFCFSQPHFGAAELDLSQSATRPINICLWRSRHVLRRKFSRKSSSKLKINYEYVCNITKNNNPNPIGKNPVASVQYLFQRFCYTDKFLYLLYIAQNARNSLRKLNNQIVQWF